MDVAELGLHDPTRPLHQHGPGVRERNAAAPPDGVSEHGALLVSAAVGFVPFQVHAFLTRQENSSTFLAGGEVFFGAAVASCCNGYYCITAAFADAVISVATARGAAVRRCSVVDRAEDCPVDSVEVDTELDAKLK